MKILQTQPKAYQYRTRRLLTTSFALLSLTLAPLTVQAAPLDDSCLSNKVTGLGGDTVLLYRFNSSEQSTVSVVELYNPNDFCPGADIFVVPAKTLTSRHKSYSFKSPEYHSDSGSYKSGIEDYRYLLAGSSISYTFCLSSKTPGQERADTIFLFKDNQYPEYVDDTDNGKKYATAAQAIPTYKEGRETCATFKYTIKEPGLYTILTQTSAGYSAHYQYREDKVFYDPNDYKSTYPSHCLVTDAANCSYHNSDLLPDTDYAILGAIKKGGEDDFPMLEMCVKKGLQNTLRQNRLLEHNKLFEHGKL